MQEDRYSLEANLYGRGRALDIYHLAINGRDEFSDFVCALRETPTESNRNFASHLGEILGMIASRGFLTPATYFKKLKGWTDLWEIRRRQGRQNHRFYGFTVADREFYIVKYMDKRTQKADREALRFVDRVRTEWTRQAARNREQ